MINSFPKARAYLESIDISAADPLDKIAKELIDSEEKYERASQALRRRFVRGASEVAVFDRGRRETSVKREGVKGNYKYFIKDAAGNWIIPEERIWVVAMYALWQTSK